MSEDTPADAIRDLIRRLEMQANTARGEAESYRVLADQELEKAVKLEHRIHAFDEALSLLTGKTST